MHQKPQRFRRWPVSRGPLITVLSLVRVLPATMGEIAISAHHSGSGREGPTFGVPLASDPHCRPVRVMTPSDIFTSTCAALRKSMPSRPETPATTRMLETQKPPTHSRGTM